MLIKKVTFLLLITSFLSIPSSFSNELRNNISINPLAFMLGIANISYERKLNDNWTLGGELAFLDIEILNTKQTGQQFGIKTRYHFNKSFEDGWQILLGAGYLSSKATTSSTICFFSCTTTSGNATVNGLYVGFVPTYMWIWESFNMNLGLGVLYFNSDIDVTSGTISETDINYNEAVPTIDFSMGVAF